MSILQVWHCKVCDIRVTCAGCVGSTVWIGTAAGYLCIYDAMSRQRLFYGVIAVGRYALQICHCPINNCVLVAVSDKTLRVYKNQVRAVKSAWSNCKDFQFVCRCVVCGHGSGRKLALDEGDRSMFALPFYDMPAISNQGWHSTKKSYYFLYVSALVS